MKKIGIYLVALMCCACGVKEPVAQQTVEQLPAIYPDYTEVTIPYNIAPLRFMLTHQVDDAVAVLSFGELKVVEQAENGKFLFSEKDWRQLMEAAKGADVQVQVYEQMKGQWTAYQKFSLHVDADEVDSYLAYRLIPPGYQPYYRMGIYQRNLTDFTEKPIVENSQTDYNCMNCHSFPMQNPDKMLMHMRAVNGGTYLIEGEAVERIDGKVSDEIPSLVYPSWHPNGELIAFSNNKTMQTFFRNDKNRIEVYDENSNVLVYSTKEHKVYTCPQLFSDKALETFPTFSPDGKTLYFCSAETPDSMQMPRDYAKIKYSLCSISFDEKTKSFGNEVDTLYNAKKEGRSAKFPRVSPDGKHLVFTISDYGNFSIWHHDADLFIVDLEKGSYKRLDAANSEDTESYHSWSSNSKWMVFSSRRDDGLYTRPYLVKVNPDGMATKPFVIPQEDPSFYQEFMFSFNIPELIKGEVKVKSSALVNAAKNATAVKVAR